MPLKSMGGGGGCPVDLVTDLGTENGIMAAIQSFFRDDPDSHSTITPKPINRSLVGLFQEIALNLVDNFFQRHEYGTLPLIV